MRRNPEGRRGRRDEDRWPSTTPKPLTAQSDSKASVGVQSSKEKHLYCCNLDATKLQPEAEAIAALPASGRSVLVDTQNLKTFSRI
jgi:hypothetical protein